MTKSAGTIVARKARSNQAGSRRIRLRWTSRVRPGLGRAGASSRSSPSPARQLLVVGQEPIGAGSIGREQQPVDPAVGVPAGPSPAHLRQPRPHVMGRCRDRDRVGRERSGVRQQFVAGQRLPPLEGGGTPGHQPRRRLVDWPDDVLQMPAVLGLDRFVDKRHLDRPDLRRILWRACLRRSAAGAAGPPSARRRVRDGVGPVNRSGRLGRRT